MESMITVIGATNEPWAVDKSFLRPGRLEKTIYIGSLCEDGRKEMMLMMLQKLEMDYKKIDAGCTKECLVINEMEEQLLHVLVQNTAGFTGADMRFLARKANIQLRKGFWSPAEIAKDSKPISSSRIDFITACIELVEQKSIKASELSDERYSAYGSWSIHFTDQSSS